MTPCILVADAVVSDKELYQKIPGAFLADPFINPTNIHVHEGMSS